MTDTNDYLSPAPPSIGQDLARLLAARQNDNPCPTPRLAPASASSTPAARNLARLLRPTPSSFTQISQARLDAARDRFDKNLKKLKQVVPDGRVVPETEDLNILEARRLKGVAVLFLDICRFSSNKSGDEDSQDRVFNMLSLFMAEMLHIVRSFDGTFEKNTGDGLMAYFGSTSETESAKVAAQVAVTMHCYNDYLISRRLADNGLPRIKFRAGIETGMVTIARIGVRGEHNSLVAVGNVPNVACKLMTLLGERDGIVVGHHTRNLLPEDWKAVTKQIENLPNFVLCGNSKPYPAYEITYRAPDPNGHLPYIDLYGAMSGLGGKGGLLGGLGEQR